MSRRKSEKNNNYTELDATIDRITVDADGEDEQLWAFYESFKDALELPADGFVIGEPVTVVDVNCDGNLMRGLTVSLRRSNGSEYEISAADVVFPPESARGSLIAAYRRWLRLDPFSAGGNPPSVRSRKHKVADDDIDLSRPVDLVVLDVMARSARCRLLESDRIITLRTGGLWEIVPGMIAGIMPRKQWRYAGHPYLSGTIQSSRIDAAALGLTPLKLENLGMWDPDDEYWGEDDRPLDPWEREIIAHGPRPLYEMEQVLPGDNIDDPFNDPIIRAVDLKNNGDASAAYDILTELCRADLRCLDAHAHLGNFKFKHFQMIALSHYEVGMRIGELSLGENFNGVLSWGLVDNRPFLRCMQGYGLCLWRLERFDEAAAIFQRLLWLNPSDNQGIRFLIDHVNTREPWHEEI